MGLGGVLDDEQTMRTRDLENRVHVGRLTKKVDGNDRFGPGGDGFFEQSRDPSCRSAASTSTNTGLAPQYVIASAVAMKVFGTVITSSPGPTPEASRASQRASVPLPTPMAVLALAIGREMLLQIRSTNGPPAKAPQSITSPIAASISLRRGA